MGLKSLFSVDEEKIHDLPVQEKFNATFKQIIVMFCVAIAILTITLVSAVVSVRTIYRKYYTMNTIQADIRIDMQALAKAFLWALSSPDEAIREEQLGKAMEKFEEFDANLTKLSAVSDDDDAISTVSSDLKKVKSNGETLGTMFTNGSSSDELFYYFNDTLYPSINDAVQDFKTVSSSTTKEADSAYVRALVIG